MNNFWFQQRLRDPLKCFYPFFVQLLLDVGANIAVVHSGALALVVKCGDHSLFVFFHRVSLFFRLVLALALLLVFLLLLLLGSHTTVLGLLIEGFFGDLFPILLLLVSVLFFLVHFRAEVGSIAADDADEVGVEGDNDDGEGQLSEDVVLLLVLDVALLGGAPAIVDGVTIVDGKEVDEAPSGLEDSTDDHHDAGATKVASVGDVVLAEPDDEVSRGDVLKDENDEVHEAVPPLDLIVQHQEELCRDSDRSECNSENANGRHTALDGDAAAAGDALSSLGLAVADAAAALLEDRLARL